MPWSRRGRGRRSGGTARHRPGRVRFVRVRPALGDRRARCTCRRSSSDAGAGDRGSRGSRAPTPSSTTKRPGPSRRAATTGRTGRRRSVRERSIRAAIRPRSAADSTRSPRARSARSCWRATSRDRCPPGSDLRRLVRALASGYPDCWAYAVDGIIGASPETLVTVSGGTVTARVLAGTAPRGADADADTAHPSRSRTSAKDHDEHLYAVQSVLAALRPAHERPRRERAALQPEAAQRLPPGDRRRRRAERRSIRARPRRGAAPDRRGGGNADGCRARGDPPARAVRPRPLRRPGRLGRCERRRRMGDRPALRAVRPRRRPAGRPATHPAASRMPAPASSPAATPRAELLETRVKFRPIVDALA